MPSPVRLPGYPLLRPDLPFAPTAPCWDSVRPLVFALSHRLAYRLPLVSPDEVLCGPDMDDCDHPDGRPATRKTPNGRFDAARFLATALPDYTPDLVMVKADGSCRLLPFGLRAVAPLRVLLIGDTHHFRTPIETLLTYAGQEPFDRILTDHDRHHLHYFHEAGFPSVHWLPLLNLKQFPPPPGNRAGLPSDATASDPSLAETVAVIGGMGPIHARRRHLVHRLRGAGIPVTAGAQPQPEAARMQGQAGVAVNQSLNGDLNLRVGEILCHGGVLATDRLAPESGLGLLFEENKHYMAFASGDELAAQARFLLDMPVAARGLAKAGAARARALFDPVRMGQILYHQVFDGAQSVEPLYHLDRDHRWGDPARQVPVDAGFAGRIALMEALQGRHQRFGAVVLGVPSGPALPVDLQRAMQSVKEDMVDLPRLRVVTTEIDQHHALLASQEETPNQAGRTTVRVLLADFEAQSEEHLADALADYPWDYVFLWQPGLRSPYHDQLLRRSLALFGYTPDPEDARLLKAEDRGAWLAVIAQARPESLPRTVAGLAGRLFDPDAHRAMAAVYARHRLRQASLQQILAAVIVDRGDPGSLDTLADALEAEEPGVFTQAIALQKQPRGGSDGLASWRTPLPTDRSQLRVLVPMPDLADASSEAAVTAVLGAVSIAQAHHFDPQLTLWIHNTDQAPAVLALLERFDLSACTEFHISSADQEAETVRVAFRHNVLVLPDLAGAGYDAGALVSRGCAARLALLMAEPVFAALPPEERPDPVLPWEEGNAHALSARLEQLIEHPDVWQALCQARLPGMDS